MLRQVQLLGSNLSNAYKMFFIQIYLKFNKRRNHLNSYKMQGECYVNIHEIEYRNYDNKQQPKE
ncbi:CLUMA_CG011723, isoform A [Clunio marinus]|uniref:CLUMA_CG011723, isoform A n=1 Tax=Clunio marinus TaxID=568069 RepID=A0A1J1IFP5_9DIPT|nr:CLUMA_CG011723, isoform A [Clunio marinus]